VDNTFLHSAVSLSRTSLAFLLMSSAHVHLERLVALPLKVPLHFLNCVADQWSRSSELPTAGRARPAFKTFFFNPHQFAAHDGRNLHQGISFVQRSPASPEYAGQLFG
jgi:hypothetical protein